MLKYPLIHPEILSALATAGHGSTVLIADANYSHRTGTNPVAPLVHLNLRPGMLTVDDVLATLITAAPVERATLMAPDDGSPSPCRERYAAMLGPAVPLDAVDRATFRATSRSPDLALTIATGDVRFYTNILLTIGAVAPVA